LNRQGRQERQEIQKADSPPGRISGLEDAEDAEKKTCRIQFGFQIQSKEESEFDLTSASAVSSAVSRLFLISLAFLAALAVQLHFSRRALPTTMCI
jgi:hypothetical protein